MRDIRRFEREANERDRYGLSYTSEPNWDDGSLGRGTGGCIHIFQTFEEREHFIQVETLREELGKVIRQRDHAIAQLTDKRTLGQLYRKLCAIERAAREGRKP